MSALALGEEGSAFCAGDFDGTTRAEIPRSPTGTVATTTLREALLLGVSETPGKRSAEDEGTTVAVILALDSFLGWATGAGALLGG